MNEFVFVVSSACFAEFYFKVTTVANKIIFIIQILVPILLIVMGTIDLVKAMLLDDEARKKSQRLFLKRMVMGVSVFFVGIIVNFIFGVINVDISCVDPSTLKSYEECEKLAGENYEWIDVTRFHLDENLVTKDNDRDWVCANTIFR